MKVIARAFYFLSQIFRKLANRLSQDDEWRKTLLSWKLANQETNIRLEYPELNSGSVVFDLGGYEGQWASDIFSKYQCNILIFEPCKTFSNNIKKRFVNNASIKILEFGLSSENQIIPIFMDADSTSTFRKGKNAIDIELRKASKFLYEGYDKIDLMKINIEGGEYDLLDHLVEEGLIRNIDNLQIQFHDFVPDAEKRMKKIQDNLKKTHSLTYQYKFLWENWNLNN